jgi:tetratricopeptide (TPR) repeat protein
MLGTLTELLCHFYQVGHFTQLEAVARTILTTIPDDMVALHFLGLAYLRTGRTGEAICLFRKTGEAFAARGAAEGADAEPGSTADASTAAAAFYREATDLNPCFADTWYDIAMELNRLGHRTQAVSALRNAIIARPDFHEALLALGNLGLQLGDCISAYRGFTGLLQVDPSSTEAKQGLERVVQCRAAAERSASQGTLL